MMLLSYHWSNLSLIALEIMRLLVQTSPLICSANQWTGFYMITVSVMKELITFLQLKSL